MARIPKPWLREQTKTWYVKIGGVQHPLGRDRKEADRLYHRLMAGEGLGTPVQGMQIGGLLEQFLADCGRTVKPATASWYRDFLGDFAGRYPRLKPADISPRHVRAWLDADRKRPWGQSTRRSAITILKRLLNWGVENRLLPANPIKDYERPAATRRERLISAEEKELILSFYPEPDVFRDFLIAMMESGCRPGEVSAVEAKHVNLQIGAWVMPGKTTSRTGNLRVIYMTPRLAEITERQMVRHPEGPIFRNADGNPWNRQAVNCRFRRKRNRKNDPIPRDITAYLYRGTWTTDALENEVPVATVAELLGHTGTAMVMKHYSRLRQKRDYLRNAMGQATRKG